MPINLGRALQFHQRLVLRAEDYFDPEQLTESVQTPEVAFTGDTTCNFFLDPANEDILHAKLLIVEVGVSYKLQATDKVHLKLRVFSWACYLNL